MKDVNHVSMSNSHDVELQNQKEYDDKDFSTFVEVLKNRINDVRELKTLQELSDPWACHSFREK